MSPLVAGAVGTLVAAVGVAAILLQRSAAETETAVVPITSVAVPAEVGIPTTTTTPTTTAAPTSVAPPPPTTVPPTAAPPTKAPAVAAAPAPPPGDPAPPPAPAASTAAAPVRYAVFKGGTVHLHGSVPTRAIADEIVAKAGAVVGPANVVDQYVIDPATAYVD